MKAFEEQLRSALAARLEAAGWRLLHYAQPALAADLERPLNAEFSVTAELSCHEGEGERLEINNVILGIVYEPLRRLWTLFGPAYQRAVHREWLADDEEDEDEDEDTCERVPMYTIASSAEVDEVASSVAALILERAGEFAGRYATVDGLVAGLKEEYEPEDVADDIAALLAAAGRYEEARAALDAGEPSRTARQVRRFIDSGGDPALIPDEPPPSRYDYRPPKRKPFLEEVARRRRESEARRQAQEAVRRRAQGKSRDEQRAILQEELTSRGLEVDGGLFIEVMLDHLWDTKADQLRWVARAVPELGRIGLGVVRALRSGEVPDLDGPDWVKPPPEACYDLVHGEGYVSVDLDPGSADWLERVHGAMPKVFGVVLNVPAWIRRDGDGSVEVSIGEQRVGRLSSENAARYSAAIAAAEFREELPTLSGRLARRSSPPRFLLDLRRP